MSDIVAFHIIVARFYLHEKTRQQMLPG